jgi:hypothetical protein
MEQVLRPPLLGIAFALSGDEGKLVTEVIQDEKQ